MKLITDIYKSIEKPAKEAVSATRKLSKYHIGQAVVIFLVVLGLVFGNWLGSVEPPHIKEVYAADSIVSVDTAGNVGTAPSLQLDSFGYPVVSYLDTTNDDLKILHCNDANCTGGNESIVTVASIDGLSNEYSSFQLDSSGYPVVSYWHFTSNTLKLVHCNDPNCAGGDESIVTVDAAVGVGRDNSLQLDSSGYPVVSYFAGSANLDLKLVHCNDVNCAGGDESIVTIDSAGRVGEFTSLQLDSSGYPVVSYYDATNQDLKILHCNDVNCAGGDESIVSVDTAGSVGLQTSLQLDSSGYPVVSYLDNTNGNLKLVHCNDPNCTGGDESIVTVDASGNLSWGETSLQLDSSGYPVVSYFDIVNEDLKLAHCNDVNCAGGDESIIAVDATDRVGEYLSIQLDSSGYPVVSYYDSTNNDLKILHCDDVNCAPPISPTVTTNDASFISISTATLNGTANPNGDSTTGWFRYSTTNPGTCNDTFGTRAPSSGGTSLGSGTSGVAYSENLTGLASSTVHYYCALASNAGGTATGTVVSFTTGSPSTYLSGWLESLTFDTGFSDGVKINSVLWQGVIGAGTSAVKFKIASANCSNGADDPPTCATNAGWGGSKTSGDGALIGPDGTSSTFYTTSVPNIPVLIATDQHNNVRYFRYLVEISRSSSLDASPIVRDIIINWSP